MKNVFKLFGIIALTAVIGFSMAACGGGDDDGDSQSVTYSGTADGTTYTLRITETPTPRYAAKNGDGYILLTSGSTNKRSTGEVTGVSGDELTLKPSNASTPFTATVSESGLTALLGTITWSDGTTASAPITLTGSGSGGTGGGGTGGTGGGSSGEGMATLNLSGQVYTEDREIDRVTYAMKTVYTPYKGSVKSFTSNVGGTGSITNGNMSFSVGTPPTSSLKTADIKDIAGTSDYNIYRDAKITPNDTQGVGLELSIDLDRININMSSNPTTGSSSTTIEMVGYIYYDRNCTVTATGGTITEQGITITYPNLNLNYKRGWNTFYYKSTSTTSYASGSGSVSGTNTLEIRLGNAPSSCKWIIDED